VVSGTIDVNLVTDHRKEINMSGWDEVKKSLEDARYQWRTIRGVAKETSLTQEEVHKIIKMHAQEVIKSSVAADSGEELFTTRQHFRRRQSVVAKIASSLTSRVSSSRGED
jgi:pantoate kinase